jgi:hypothetical protein
MKPDLIFYYRNWKGEKSIRRVLGPLQFFRGTTQWHHEEQMFLNAYDISKAAVRDFAVNDIIAFVYDVEDHPPPKDGTILDLFTFNTTLENVYWAKDRCWIEGLGWSTPNGMQVLKPNCDVKFWRKSP